MRTALRGVVEICLGEARRADGFSGKALSRHALLRPSATDNLITPEPLCRWGCTSLSGLVDEMREALRCAEPFGDVSGIIAALWAHGTALLRAGTAVPR